MESLGDTSCHQPRVIWFVMKDTPLKPVAITVDNSFCEQLILTRG